MPHADCGLLSVVSLVERDTRGNINPPICIPLFTWIDTALTLLYFFLYPKAQNIFYTKKQINNMKFSKKQTSFWLLTLPLFAFLLNLSMSKIQQEEEEEEEDDGAIQQLRGGKVNYDEEYEERYLQNSIVSLDEPGKITEKECPKPTGLGIWPFKKKCEACGCLKAFSRAAGPTKVTTCEKIKVGGSVSGNPPVVGGECLMEREVKSESALDWRGFHGTCELDPNGWGLAFCDCKVNLTAVAEWQKNETNSSSQEGDHEAEPICLGPCTNSTSTTSTDDLVTLPDLSVDETEVMESPGWELP